MSTSTDGVSSPATKPRRSWFKVRAALAAVVLVLGFGAWLSWRNGLPPRVVMQLSQGRVYLDTPVMTLYSFPPIEASGFYATTNFSLSQSTAIAFTWVNVTGVTLPVRFVLTGDGLVDPGPANGFTYRSAGTGTSFGIGLNKPGVGGVLYSTWAIDYTIQELAVHDWLGDDHWIEVDYALRPVFMCACDLPAANTTLPTSDVLTPVGAPIRLQYGSGFAWSVTVALHQFTLPSGPFLHRLPALTFPAGTAGTLHAALVSSFQWGQRDDYQMRMGATGAANLSFQLYVDTRFGSLLATSAT